MKCRALWDTGSTTSGISPKAVRTLDLKPRGKGDVTFQDEVKEKLYYRARVTIASNSGNDSKIDFNMLMHEFDSQTDFDIIIGMNVISIADITIRGGQSWIWFDAIIPGEKYRQAGKDPDRLRGYAEHD